MTVGKDFGLRYFSTYVFESSDNDRRERGIALTAPNNSWYHYPQRSDLYFTVVSKVEGALIYVLHGRGIFETVWIDELSIAYSKFVARYPAIGFKQTNSRGELVKRFQMEFESLDKFIECRDYLISKGFKVRDADDKGGNGNGVQQSQVQQAQVQQAQVSPKQQAPTVVNHISNFTININYPTRQTSPVVIHNHYPTT